MRYWCSRCEAEVAEPTCYECGPDGHRAAPLETASTTGGASAAAPSPAPDGGGPFEAPQAADVIDFPASGDGRSGDPPPPETEATDQPTPAAGTAPTENARADAGATAAAGTVNWGDGTGQSAPTQPERTETASPLRARQRDAGRRTDAVGDGTSTQGDVLIGGEPELTPLLDDGFGVILAAGLARTGKTQFVVGLCERCQDLGEWRGGPLTRDIVNERGHAIRTPPGEVRAYHLSCTDEKLIYADVSGEMIRRAHPDHGSAAMSVRFLRLVAKRLRGLILTVDLLKLWGIEEEGDDSTPEERKAHRDQTAVLADLVAVLRCLRGSPVEPAPGEKLTAWAARVTKAHRVPLLDVPVVVAFTKADLLGNDERIVVPRRLAGDARPRRVNPVQEHAYFFGRRCVPDIHGSLEKHARRFRFDFIECLEVDPLSGTTVEEGLGPIGPYLATRWLIRESRAKRRVRTRTWLRLQRWIDKLRGRGGRWKALPASAPQAVGDPEGDRPSPPTSRRVSRIALALWLVAVVAAAVGIVVLHGNLPRAELAAGEVSVAPSAVARLERGWVTDAFPPVEGEYLFSGLGPMPCPSGTTETNATHRRACAEAIDLARRGRADEAIGRLSGLAAGEPSAHLPALTLGMVLIEERRYDEARLVLDRYLSHSPANDIVAAAARDQPASAPHSEVVSAVIHAYHALAWLHRSRGDTGRHIWLPLKRRIAGVEILVQRGHVGGVGGLEKWHHVRLAAPGCPADDASLTSDDLYGDLIASYLWTKSYTNPRGRDREFSRPYDEDAATNPLLATFRGMVATGLTPQDEYLAWAASNAERLLHRFTAPESPRVAHALVQLIDAVEGRCPPDGLETLRRQRAVLARTAVRQLAVLSDAERRAVADLCLRPALLDAVASGTPVTVSPAGLEGLTAERQAVVRTLGETVAWRARLPEWTVAPESAEAAIADLPAELRDAWRDAFRADAAVAVARRAAAVPSGPERTALLARSRALLPSDPALRSEWQSVTEEMPWTDRWWARVQGPLTTPWVPWLTLLLAAALLGIPVLWLRRHEQEWREQFASFHACEAAWLDRRDKRREDEGA